MIMNVLVPILDRPRLGLGDVPCAVATTADAPRIILRRRVRSEGIAIQHNCSAQRPDTDANGGRQRRRFGSGGLQRFAVRDIEAKGKRFCRCMLLRQ